MEQHPSTSRCQNTGVMLVSRCVGCLLFIYFYCFVDLSVNRLDAEYLKNVWMYIQYIYIYIIYTDSCI